MTIHHHTANNHNERTLQRQHFIERCQKNQHFQEYKCEALEQDASKRCYFRLIDSQTSQSFILMDAPPEHENIVPFINIDLHLQKLGQCVPYIFEQDIEQGFILLEDFGKNTFRKLLHQSANTELSLYRKAVQCLIDIHQQKLATDILVPEYNFDVFLREAMLFVDCFYPYCTNKELSTQQKQDYKDAWRTIWDKMPPLTNTLVLRDYHIDNLMIVDREYDHQLCGLLDFQDALIGSPVYDLVSLTEDARRKVDSVVVDSVVKQYIAACVEPSQQNDFMTHYVIWGCQRHAKVLGIFCLFYQRDGKDKYLHYLPHIHKLFFSHINNPIYAETFRPIKQWLDIHFPESYDETLP